MFLTSCILKIFITYFHNTYCHHAYSLQCIYIYVDRRIGMKAEEAGAVLLTLNLLKHNGQHARRTAACLWVIQVFCSSGKQYSCFCHQLGVKFISWRLTLKIIIAAISLNSNPNFTLILNPTLYIVIQSTLLLNSSLTSKASTLIFKGRVFQELYLLLCLNLYVDNLSNRVKVSCVVLTVSTANLIGENHGLDVIYRLIPQYTTKHLHAIK